MCPHDLRVWQVLKAIKVNPLQSISDLGRQVDLSKSWMNHRFKTEMGVTLGVFIAEQRLEMAATLLRSTNKQIKEITHAVGYEHEPSFVRAFKRKFNCSPGVYRIMHKTLLVAGMSEEERKRVLAMRDSLPVENANKNTDLLTEIS
jgi:AraC-like DNA-binding protein